MTTLEKIIEVLERYSEAVPELKNEDLTKAIASEILIENEKSQGNKVVQTGSNVEISDKPF